MSKTNFTFGTKLKFRDELEHGTQDEVNRFISYRGTFQGKVMFLVGMGPNAFAVVPELGSMNFEFISGHPSTLFTPTK